MENTKVMTEEEYKKLNKKLFWSMMAGNTILLAAVVGGAVALKKYLDNKG